MRNRLYVHTSYGTTTRTPSSTAGLHCLPLSVRLIRHSSIIDIAPGSAEQEGYNLFPSILPAAILLIQIRPRTSDNHAAARCNLVPTAPPMSCAVAALCCCFAGPAAVTKRESPAITISIVIAHWVCAEQRHDQQLYWAPHSQAKEKVMRIFLINHRLLVWRVTILMQP